MPQAGGLVPHAIEVPRQEIVSGNIAVVALVKGLETKEVRGGSRGSGGAFALPILSGSIVMEGLDRVFSHVGGLGDDVVMHYCGRQLQITVGDISL